MKDMSPTVQTEGQREEARWYLLRSAGSSLNHRKVLDNEKITYFLPTRFAMQEVAGKRLRVERPVVYNFIFVHERISRLKEFLKRETKLHLAYRQRFLDDTMNSEKNLLIIIPDSSMRSFIKTVGEYKEAVPFVQPTEEMLKKGDHVRIIEGPFAGVEGILLCTQGRDGGRVLVSISNEIAVPTLEIKPAQLQVLRFAEKGKHMYKKFDSFIGKARRALHNFYGNKLDDKDRAALTTFVKRFAQLETHTVNARLKLLVYLHICYTCLMKKEDAERVEIEQNDLLPQVHSGMFRALALVNMYACTARDSYRKEAEEIVKEWGELSDKERTKIGIMLDLDRYTRVLRDPAKVYNSQHLISHLSDEIMSRRKG